MAPPERDRRVARTTAEIGAMRRASSIVVLRVNAACPVHPSRRSRFSGTA